MAASAAAAHQTGSSEKAIVTLRKAEGPPPSTTWLGRLVSWPPYLLDMAYNTALCVRHRGDLWTPFAARMQAFDGYVDTIYTVFATMRFVKDPTLARAIFQHFRKNVLDSDSDQGFFSEEMNQTSIFGIAHDLFPEIQPDDLLLTCNKNFVTQYREQILTAVGKDAIEKDAAKDGPKKLMAIVTETLASWKEEEGSIDITTLTKVYGTAVITRWLLGLDSSKAECEKLTQAIGHLNAHGIRVLSKMHSTAEQILQYQGALELLRTTINTTFDTDGSFVSQLKGSNLSEVQIKGLLFLMYFGGTETTASSLTYTLWQLGQKPDIQSAIHQGGLQEKSVQAVIKESLRLFPPVYLLGRQAAIDLELNMTQGGKTLFAERINQGEIVVFSPLATGRLSEVFDNPHVFDPNREYPEQSMPFGVGKHLCPGKNLAMAEMTLLVCELIRQFTFTSSPDTEPPQIGHMTLQLRDPVFLTLTRRDPP